MQPKNKSICSRLDNHIMWLSNRDCLTVSQNSVSDWVRHKSDSQTVRESKSHSQTHNARINQSVSKWGKWLAYSLAPFNVLFKTAFRQSYWDDWARGICCWHRKFKNVSNIHTCIYTKRNLSTQTIFSHLYIYFHVVIALHVKCFIFKTN